MVYFGTFIEVVCHKLGESFYVPLAQRTNLSADAFDALPMGEKVSRLPVCKEDCSRVIVHRDKWGQSDDPDPARYWVVPGDAPSEGSRFADNFWDLFETEDQARAAEAPIQ